MAITEIFVNPAIAADSGTGTVGDPYGDLRYAIEQETFDTTNGTRLNIKAGTSEVLTEKLDTSMADTGTSVAWAPLITAPLIIQGYTTSAGDGGIGVIDGDGTYSIFDAGTSPDYIVFRDLRLTNTGSNDVVLLDDGVVMINCEVDTSTTDGVELGADALVLGCYFHDIGNFCLRSVGPGLYLGNVVDATGASRGIFHSTNDIVVDGNCVKTSSSGQGIHISNRVFAFNNSVFSTGGTGSGITSRTAAAGDTLACMNNVVAGFSGTGGIGIDYLGNASNTLQITGGNSVYDCETAIQSSLKDWVDLGDETLSSAPFTDATNLDFAPVDTGSVSEGSEPSAFHSELSANNVYARWRGAVEPSETSPSGNQLALYRGAVQPAYVAPSSSGGQARSGPGFTFGIMGRMGA